MKNGKNTPKVYLSMSYETFGGSGSRAYLCPLRAGLIPFSEMKCLGRDALPPDGGFEITEVTEDTFTFVVDPEFSGKGEREIHTLPIREGVGVFRHAEKRSESIEGDTFTYTREKMLVVKTAKQVMRLEATYGDDGKAWAQAPYAPGTHKIVCEYPFTLDGIDGGYDFGHITVGEDMGVRYLDDGETYYFTEEMQRTFRAFVFTRTVGEEQITVKLRLDDPDDRL